MSCFPASPAFISQLVMLQATQQYCGTAGGEFLRCDGKLYDGYTAPYSLLFSLIGFNFGGYVSGTKYLFATPNMPDPAPGLSWYICYQGIFPTRP